jgi:uncharacterized protein (TIGR02611 family)
MSTPEQPELVRRLLARRDQHVKRHPAYRIAFGILGALVLAGGVVMLVAPGPAFVLIPAGLAMLALEFEWAERLLVKALVQGERAREKARSTSPAQKALGALAGLAVAAAAVFLALRYVF